MLARLGQCWHSATAWLDAKERNGKFSLALLIGDAGLVTWLALAQQAFTDHLPTPWFQVALPAALTALLAWILRWHDFHEGRILRLATKGLGVALATGVGLVVLSAAGGVRSTTGAQLWLAGAAGVLLFVMRVVYFAARATWPGQRLEMLRWLALAAAMTALFWPYFTADSMGSGDAYWYTLMLADFVAQLRAGVFPVWVGQSVYAFNGTVSPLRLAPWFQHVGKLLDFITWHALSLVALKNVTLVVNAMVGAFATYGCLRSILATRPTIAAILAWLWLASPGVLAPLMCGDQYMTFMTLPFVPLALYGCWRAWNQGDRMAGICLAAGLAGLWLSHSPIALWLSLLSALQYLALILVRRSWRSELLRVASMAIIFIVLGSLPFVSVLSLDNLIRVQTYVGSVVQEIARAFPANFLPIDLHTDIIFAYQLGYTAAAAGLLALLLSLWIRPKGATAFAASVVFLGPFTLPVPWLNAKLWASLPWWFVTINNVWPMQRLFLVWSSVIFFGLAIVISDSRIARRTWCVWLLGLFLIAGCGWSWHEAGKLDFQVVRSRIPPKSEAGMLAPQNVMLTRYCYSIFEWTPAYVNHGYMDPVLENRLIDPQTGSVLMANADAAAPLLATNTKGWFTRVSHPRLMQSGLFAASQIGDTRIYALTPEFELAPGKHYVLRFEFVRPDETGVLQILHDRLFREYLLPDAGAGLGRRGPSLTFGSEPQCSKILPLQFDGPDRITPTLQFVAPQPGQTSFPFARYWLYTYDPSELPVAVESWIPYRVRVHTAVSAWLETPRIWQPQWHATVNGRAVTVQRTPQNLAAIPVGPGDSEVILKYQPPFLLSLSYGVCLAGWGILLAAGWIAVCRVAPHFAGAR